MEQAVFTDVKQEREANIREITEKLTARYEEDILVADFLMLRYTNSKRTLSVR